MGPKASVQVASTCPVHTTVDSDGCDILEMEISWKVLNFIGDIYYYGNQSGKTNKHICCMSNVNNTSIVVE